MTRAQEKAERKDKAITLATTAKAARALRFDKEQEFHELFPNCDVGLKFIWTRFVDGKDVESDLFSAACLGIRIRKKSDLARLIVEKMIADGVDLRTHRTNTEFGFTTLMMAASYCDRSVLEIVLPFSDVDATTLDGFTALELARAVSLEDNAEYIEGFILSQSEAEMFEDIPIPSPDPEKRRKSIDDR
jgi:hypothetical protein